VHREKERESLIKKKKKKKKKEKTSGRIFARNSLAVSCVCKNRGEEKR
jgi:hypothetical protein